MTLEPSGNFIQQMVDGQPLIVSVEDNEDNRLLSIFVLEELGYSYIAVSDGLTALKLIQHYQPDLILLDIGLPGIDGLEVVRCLKQAPQTTKIPVIAVTAKAMVGEREEIIAAGCDDYISKPYEIELLARLINDYLNR